MSKISDIGEDLQRQTADDTSAVRRPVLAKSNYISSASKLDERPHDITGAGIGSRSHYVTEIKTLIDTDIRGGISGGVARRSSYLSGDTGDRIRPGNYSSSFLANGLQGSARSPIGGIGLPSRIGERHIISSGLGVGREDREAGSSNYTGYYSTGATGALAATAAGAGTTYTSSVPKFTMPPSSLGVLTGTTTTGNVISTGIGSLPPRGSSVDFHSSSVVYKTVSNTSPTGVITDIRRSEHKSESRAEQRADSLHQSRHDSTHIIRERDSSADPRQRMSRTSLIAAKESIIHHDPKLVEVRRLEPVEVGSHTFQPVLKGLIETESKETTVVGVNLKLMLIDCYKRIVLLGMENDRLVGKNAELESIVFELTTKLTTVESQLTEFEKIRSEYMRFKSRSESLEVTINGMLKERSEYLTEIERLKLMLKESSEYELRFTSISTNYTNLKERA
jgi:hypothetical protein